MGDGGEALRSHGIGLFGDGRTYLSPVALPLYLYSVLLAYGASGTPVAFDLPVGIGLPLR